MGRRVSGVRFLDALGLHGTEKLIVEELRGVVLCTPSVPEEDVEDWIEDLAQLAWRLRREREDQHGR